MRKLILWPNSRLKLASAAVDVEEANRDPNAVKSLRVLVEDMAVVMGTYGGVGLAAIQLDVPVRVITTLVDGVPRVFVNPTILEKEGETELMREGCLSVPDYFDRIRRYPTVAVEFQSLLTDGIGPKETVRAHGLLAQVLQHEINHLDGKLFIDDLPASVRQNIRGELLRRKRLGQLRDYR